MMTGKVELEAFDPDQAEQVDLLAWYEFAMAVREQEKPDREAQPFDRWIADLRLPDAGYGPREFWGVRRGGELVATVSAYLVEGESDQVALTSITVAPDRRRAGVGTAVLHLLLPLLEARGRTVVEGWDLPEDGPGHHWANAVGLRTAKSMVVQRLDTAAVDPVAWDVSVPAGYRVVTLLDFYPTLPTWGVQRDTVVVPSERGRGVGLCVKARMLRWLREQRPEIARVHTGTGSDNEHMIRINHLLGYRTTSVSVGVNAKISELRDRRVEAAGRKIE